MFEYGFSAAKDEDLPGLARLATAMQAKGAKAVLQLTHAGCFARHTLTKYGFVYGPRSIKEIVDEYAQATRRRDEYGAQSFENRSRLGLEVFAAVQEVIAREAEPGFILGFRGTPEETRSSQIGYPVEEILEFVDRALVLARINYLAIASWGHDVFRNVIRARGKYQGRLVTEVVRDHFRGRLPVMATGGDQQRG